MLQDTQAPLPPPYSCRSGLPVCFLAKTNEGIQMLPFKLRVRKREELGSVHHVVTMDECKWEHAFDQRRLSLMVDPLGKIVSASNTPHALFGFSPRHLVGMSCAEIIDALRPSGGDRTAKDPALRAAAAATDAEELQLLLLQLAKRAQAQPGLSWRVGVSPPGDEQQPGGELAAQLASSQRKTRAAVMTVSASATSNCHACNRTLAAHVALHVLVSIGPMVLILWFLSLWLIPSHMLLAFCRWGCMWEVRPTTVVAVQPL
jgi:hypothetical protein